MGYNEIYISFAINKLLVSKFELLIGFHPHKNRYFTEEEENLFFNFIQFVREEDIRLCDDSIGYMEVAKLFLKCFPNVKNYKQEDLFFQNEWDKIIDEVDILQIGYVFHPEDFKIRKKVMNDIEKFKNSFFQNIDRNINLKDKIIWNLSFPFMAYFGKKVEEKYGVDNELKAKISLNKYPSGFIANYLTHNNADFNDLLNSRQFEELVGLLYENEGWDIKITKKTRDGGKDAIATKFENGNKIVAYIEAKNPKKNKIDVPKIREFFGVIRDETNHGYFVSSSGFTEDAKKWAEQKKLISPVILELIDNIGIRQKLNKIVGEEGYKYLIKL